MFLDEKTAEELVNFYESEPDTVIVSRLASRCLDRFRDGLIMDVADQLFFAARGRLERGEPKDDPEDFEVDGEDDDDDEDGEDDEWSR